jgi:hypothetical protein
MLRTAIVGLGWWERNLVTAVQGKTDDIRFTVGCTRGRTKAADFCAENSIPIVGDYESVVSDPER